VHTTSASAFEAGLELGALHGLPIDRAVVRKDGSNLIVHLAPAPVVLRIATFTGEIRTDPLPWLEREVALVSHLAAVGASVMPPSDIIPPGPHVVGGWAMSAWRYVEHRPDLVPDTAASLAALDDLHAALRSYDHDLPLLNPTGDDLERALRFGLAHGVFDEARVDAVRHRRDELAAAVLSTTLDRQALHGDAFPRNSLVARDGRIVWIDFEDCCSGPLLWDLATLIRQGSPDPAVRSRVAERYGAEALETAIELRQVQLDVWNVLHDARRSGTLGSQP